MKIPRYLRRAQEWAFEVSRLARLQRLAERARPNPIPDGWREWTVEDELRHALIQAMHTIAFLDGCLTQPNFKYAHPEMTARKLTEFSLLIQGAPECTAGQFSSQHPPGVCPVHHRLMPKEE